MSVDKNQQRTFFFLQVAGFTCRSFLPGHADIDIYWPHLGNRYGDT